MKHVLKTFIFFTSAISVFSITSCGNYDVDFATQKTFKVTFSDDFKFDYMLNETISYDGLTVCDSATNEEIDTYFISPNEGMRLRTPGKVEVTISKDNYKDYTFSINVENDGTYVETKRIDLYSVNDFHGSFKSIEKGNPEVLYIIGRMLFEGYKFYTSSNYAKNPQVGVDLIRKSAKLGFGEAENYISIQDELRAKKEKMLSNVLKDFSGGG